MGDFNPNENNNGQQSNQSADQSQQQNQQSGYNQSPYNQPNYSQPQYNQPQYNQQQYNQPQQQQPQYGGQSQYQQPQDQQPYNQQSQYQQTQYQQTPYQQPYNQYQQPKRNNAMAIASLACGIVSLVLCCTGGFSFLIGAAGIVLGILYIKNNKDADNKNDKTMAIVGIALSGVGALIGLIGFFGCILSINNEINSDIWDFETYY